MDEHIEVTFTVGGTYTVEVPKGNRTKTEVIDAALIEVDEALYQLNESHLDLHLDLMANEPDIDWDE
jgi:hypothetical protein